MSLKEYFLDGLSQVDKALFECETTEELEEFLSMIKKTGQKHNKILLDRKAMGNAKKIKYEDDKVDINVLKRDIAFYLTEAKSKEDLDDRVDGLIFWIQQNKDKIIKNMKENIIKMTKQDKMIRNIIRRYGKSYLKEDESNLDELVGLFKAGFAVAVTKENLNE